MNDPLDGLFKIFVGFGIFLPLGVATIYFGVKAARYGWLRAEELFVGRKLDRTIKPEEIHDESE